MLKWLGKIINTIVEAVTEVVDDVINAVAEFVADIFETIGNLIADAFYALDSLLPGSTASIFTWLGNVISSVFTLAGALIKTVLNVVSNVITGAIRIALGAITAVLTGDLSLLLKGFQDFTEAIGGIVVFVLKAWEVVQAVFIPTQIRRRLTPAEAAMLERIYQGSLALFNIRLVDRHAGVFAVGYPFVLGNIIYLNGKNVDPDDPTSEDYVLVHESIHVWQYQIEGGGYASNAIFAGALYEGTDDSHGWRVEIEAYQNLRFQDFNKEAQGWFLEDVYQFGELLPGTPPAVNDGVFFDADNVTTFGRFEGSFPHNLLDDVTQDYTHIANAAVDYIRGKINVRLSKFIP